MDNLSNNYLLLTSTGEVQSNVDNGRGLIATALISMIACERAPELFDIKIWKGEKANKLIQLIEDDKALCIDRKDKPVYLTNTQQRLMYALSYAISQQMDSEDVKKKIAEPFEDGNKVERIVNIDSLAIFIYGSARQRVRQKVMRDLCYISRIGQIQIINVGKRKFELISPFIQLGRSLKEITPEELLDEKTRRIDVAEVTFGSAFFAEFDKRFSVITPKLFEIWRKGGRGTELFGVLLNNLCSVYYQFRIAARNAEERVRREDKRLPQEEQAQHIAEAKRKALLYDINVSRIKNKVTRDYDSKRSYNVAFWKDLKNTIKGLKELGLITDAYVSKGANKQEKVTFLFSENYNSADNSNETPLLLEEKNDDEDEYPSPF